MSVPPRPAAPSAPVIGAPSGSPAVGSAPSWAAIPEASGSPAPAAALPRAGVGQRLGGYAIDLILVLAVGAAGVLLGSWLLGTVLALEVVVAVLVVEARHGVTPGKLATGTRATTAGADLAPGLRREAARAGIFGAAHLLAGLGQIALLAASGRARAWHDRVAGTEVVSLRKPSTRRSSARGSAARAAASPVPAIPSPPTQPTPPPAGGTWPGAVAAGPAGPVGAPPTGGTWRPPELLDVPMSSDSISMREFRALRESVGWAGTSGAGEAGRSGVPAAAVGAPPAPSAPPVPVVPPRPGAATPSGPAIPSGAAAPGTVSPPSAAAPAAVAPPSTPAPTARTDASAASTAVPGASPAPSSSTGFQPPAVPAGPPAPSRVTSVVLTTRGGERHVVTGSAVVGRRPRAETEDVQVVEIADVARSLSRTHLRIRIIEGVAWVEDAGSANGTRLVTPDGAGTPLASGSPARLVPGAVLELGQVSIDVQLD